MTLPSQSPANSITPAIVMLPETSPKGVINSTHRTTNKDLMSNSNPTMTRASL